MYHPTDVHIGRKMREKRVALGMSQAALAEQLGITFQQVQKYEKGINRIGASRLYDISKVLDVSVQYFYDQAPGSDAKGAFAEGLADGGGESYVADVLSSRDGLELNKAFARIEDPRVRRSIVDLVRSLAGES